MNNTKIFYVTGTIVGYNEDGSKLLMKPKSINPDSYSKLTNNSIECFYFRNNTEEKNQYKEGDACVALGFNVPNYDSPFSFIFYIFGVFSGGNFPLPTEYNKKLLEN